MSAARQTAPRRRLKDVNGTTLRLHEYGDPDAEPVLALHSAGLDGEEFHEFALNLLERGDYRFIAMDYRGHGPSAGGGTRVSLAGIAHDVSALIEALDLDGVHLLGHSVGGVIAGLSAVQSHARLRSLTIASTPPQGQHVFLQRAREARANGMPAVAGPTLARWFSEHELQTSGPAVTYAAAAVRRTPLETWSSLWESFAEFQGFPAPPEVPLLCVTGEHDKSTPPAVVELTRAALGGDTPLQVLPGGSHQIFLTHPEILAGIWHNWADNRLSTERPAGDAAHQRIGLTHPEQAAGPKGKKA